MELEWQDGARSGTSVSQVGALLGTEHELHVGPVWEEGLLIERREGCIPVNNWGSLPCGQRVQAVQQAWGFRLFGVLVGPGNVIQHVQRKVLSIKFHVIALQEWNAVFMKLCCRNLPNLHAGAGMTRRAQHCHVL